MTDFAKAREAVKSALTRALDEECVRFDAADNGWIDGSFNWTLLCDAFLSSLGEDYVVVPRVATEAMISAGYEAMVENGDYETPEQGDWVPRLNADVWRAMIEAAESK